MKEAGVGLCAAFGGRRRRRPRPDRRRHRRADHGESDRDGARHAADRGEPSRGPRADAAADLRAGVSLLPVSRLRRSHPDRRGDRRRQLCPARHHRRRRHGRGLRQGRKDARAALSRRTGGRARRRRRRPERFAFPRPMLGRAGRQFLAVGIEDRGAQRGQPARPAGAAGHQRSLRQLSGGGAGIDRRPAERRLAVVSRTVRPAARAGRRRRRRRQSGDPRRAAGCRRKGADHADHSAAGALHRQRRDDRLGRRGAAGARPGRYHGRRPPRALAARRQRHGAGRDMPTRGRGFRRRGTSCRLTIPSR